MIGRTVFTVLAIASVACGTGLPRPVTENAYIVYGDSLETVTSAVLAVNGEITHELGIIDAVGAQLSQVQLDALRAQGGITEVFADGPVKAAAISAVAKIADTGGSGNGNSGRPSH